MEQPDGMVWWKNDVNNNKTLDQRCDNDEWMRTTWTTTMMMVMMMMM